MRACKTGGNLGQIPRSMSSFDIIGTALFCELFHFCCLTVCKQLSGAGLRPTSGTGPSRQLPRRRLRGQQRPRGRPRGSAEPVLAGAAGHAKQRVLSGGGEQGDPGGGRGETTQSFGLAPGFQVARCLELNKFLPLFRLALAEVM